MSSYKFSWNTSKLNGIKKNIDVALLEMGQTITNRARGKAPVESGALVNSIHTEAPESGTVLVIAGGRNGGKTVAYARKREYENCKNPQTKLYMTNSFKEVATNFKQFFKGVTK